MTPPTEPESSSDLNETAERQFFLAANETSLAFIGGLRHSWMSSVPANSTPASRVRVQKNKPARVKRKSIFKPRAQSAVASPQRASVAEAITPFQRSREPISTMLPPQQVPPLPASSEDVMLAPENIMTAIQNEQRAVMTGNSPRAMPLSEQHIIGVATTASSTAAQLPEAYDNIQSSRPPSAPSPTAAEQGASRDASQNLADGPHIFRRSSEPSQAQMPPAAHAHAPAHPASMSPGVTVISSNTLRQQSQPSQATTQAMVQGATQTNTQATTHSPTQYPFESWRQSILNRVSELDSKGNRINALERWRYAKLIEACAHRDLTYLNFHRILCQWSWDQQHPQVARTANPTIAAALNTMLQYFRPASEMTPHHISWFIQFPWDPFCPSRSFAFHHNNIQEVFKFLGKFAQTWNEALSSVVIRQFPFLAHELINIMECPSEVLRVVLFSVSWRSLGLKDGPEAARLGAIFEMDKRNEMLAASGNVDAQCVDRNRRAVIAQYHEMLDAATQQSRFHVSGPSASSPSILTPILTPVTHQRNDVFVTTGDTVPAAEVASTAHHSASSGNIASTGIGLSGSRTAAAPTHLTNQTPYAEAQAQCNIQPSYQQAASIEPSGNSFIPRTNRPSHQQGRVMSTPSVTVRLRASPANTTLLSSPSAVNANQVYATHATFRGSSDWRAPLVRSPIVSQTRGRPVQSRPIRPPLNTPSSAPMASPRPEVDGSEGYSTAPLPHSQYPLSPYNWTSVQVGLHLLRSRSPDRMNCGGGETRYYQFLSRFAIDPTPIYPQKGIQKFEFTVTADEFCLKSKLGRTEDSTVHHFKHGSLRYRLRLIKRDQKSQVIDSISWLTSSSIWPAEIYILFNEEPVYPKRGHHFHHDLPIELTDLLQLGLNTISISLPQGIVSLTETSGYYLAVEIIITMDHASTLDMICKEQKTGADQTRREIRRRMQLTASDDVIVQDDCLCISVTDPFSASMFEIPVRGVGCKHFECFDLETWLQTRRSKKPESRTEPSLADGWKCPICNGDASPPNLRIDEFLMEVRRALTLANKGQTKSIVAYLDGTWSANEEPRDDTNEGVDGQGKEEIAKQIPAPRKEPQVIEILDD